MINVYVSENVFDFNDKDTYVNYCDVSGKQKEIQSLHLLNECP